MQGNESISSVERDFVERKRDRDSESVQTLSKSRNLHVYLEQKAELAVEGECAAQKKSEAEAEMDVRNWEQRNCDIARYENQSRTRISKIGTVVGRASPTLQEQFSTTEADRSARNHILLRPQSELSAH